MYVCLGFSRRIHVYHTSPPLREFVSPSRVSLCLSFCTRLSSSLAILCCLYCFFFLFSSKTDQTRLQMRLGGSTLFSVLLPASPIAGWSLSHMTELQRIRNCDCIHLILFAPHPPAFVEFTLFLKGNSGVRPEGADCTACVHALFTSSSKELLLLGLLLRFILVSLGSSEICQEKKMRDEVSTRL